MPIIAMKCTKAEPVPEADSLRVYSFADENGAELQIVANLTNVYEVGDTAAIAQIGTTLTDGLVIKKAKIRGVHSFGMACGKTDSAVGTDVSKEFGAVDAP